MEPLDKKYFTVNCNYRCHSNGKCQNIETATKKHPELLDLFNGIIRDKIGQEIKEGSYIAYGSLLGRSAALKIGKVLKVSYKVPEGYDYSFGPRITVQGVERRWKNEELQLSAKGTLQFPDRVVVIEDSKVPLEIRKLLD